nr:ABC transporter ATP-binding protein [Tistlia consotensis]
MTKRFPGVVANDGISLTFRRGEVHALLGENGAGKSTLISILSGMQQPDEGEIRIAGRAVRIASPRAALKLGIGTVYQHVLLIPSLTVLENLMLGGPWWRPLDRAATLKRFEELSGLLSARLDPDAPVGRLSLGQQQQLEIMRALWHGELVLILDEPTSMLTPQGVRELGVVIRRLRDHGVAVVFITHKLGEAYELADRITVLRLGKVVGELAPGQLRELDERQVVDAVIGFMFGRREAGEALEETLTGEAEALPRHAVDRSGAPALALQGAATRGERGECPLQEAELEVWPGEILGIAGIDGNGQKHLAEALAGQRPLSAGRMVLNGRDVTGMEVVQRRSVGVRYITDERLGEGTAAAHSVATNLVLKQIGRPPFWAGGLTRWPAIHRHAREQIQVHDVRTPSEQTPIAKLSGGNIQKVLLARELDPEARLVIFNKPTYGLDLQNTKLARDRIRAGAGTRGAALVVISNELDELLETCDRIAVMDGGTIVGVVENAPGAEAAIGRLMIGADAA